MGSVKTIRVVTTNVGKTRERKWNAAFNKRILYKMHKYTKVLLARCNSSIDQTSGESAVLTLEISALNKKQACAQNLLEVTSQLQSSGTVTLKPTSSIKTNLKQKSSCINYRFRVGASPSNSPLHLCAIPRSTSLTVDLNTLWE